MSHNAMCVQQACSYLFFCCSSKSQETCTYGSIFPVEKRQTRKWEDVFEIQTTRSLKEKSCFNGSRQKQTLRSNFTGYNRGLYVLLCSNMLRQQPSQEQFIHNVPLQSFTSFFIFSPEFIRTQWAQLQRTQQLFFQPRCLEGRGQEMH